MKRLLLMRHADALSLDFISEDFNRGLSPLGIEQAGEAGDFIKGQYIIDKVITSPSHRTVQTISTIMARCAIENGMPLLPVASVTPVRTLYSSKDDHKAIREVEVSYQLYRSSYANIIQLISDEPDSVENLMVLGHNPDIFKTALELADKDNPLFDVLLSAGMKTATIVVLVFKGLGAWKEMKSHQGNIARLFFPMNE